MGGLKSKTLIWLQLLLLLVSQGFAYTPTARGDNCCILDNRFGEFCPTTCGVAKFFLQYKPDIDHQLEDIERSLAQISNFTTGTKNTIQHVRDESRARQKSSDDTYITKVRSMLDDVARYENTIVSQDSELLQLQGLHKSNEQLLHELRAHAVKLQENCNEPCKDTVEISEITGKDCQEVADKGAKESGLYFLKPLRSKDQFLVYCEIDELGNGWTVLQRRRDGSVDFFRNWIQYKEGFGYLSPKDTSEFWLGNEKTHLITTQSQIPYRLRITLKDWSDVTRNADYAVFKLGPEADKYRFTYAYFMEGEAGNAFDGVDFGDDASDKHFTSHNGMQFSTSDSDNDNYQGNCATQDRSGWWMNRCHAAHLNGRYYQGGEYTAEDAGLGAYDNGIIWATWHSRWYSLKETTMKIIPITKDLKTRQGQVTVDDHKKAGV
ncbi:fibrinogen gamma chain isoform X2 [Latimeria chalumnae]|uniref:fibrinogen gamma chain isoform X2 n=1 Tax=Latimeria chalumnae TaxID=7897 RepID=UPI00313E035B